jgi:hypothetical protein
MLTGMLFLFSVCNRRTATNTLSRTSWMLKIKVEVAMKKLPSQFYTGLVRDVVIACVRSVQ